MKKLSIIALVLVLTISFCACGRRNNEPTVPTPTVENPAPSTAPVNPNTDPTLDTNIPDPEVDSNSTMPGGMTTDPGNDTQSGTSSSSSNGAEQPNTNENAKSRMRKIK